MGMTMCTRIRLSVAHAPHTFDKTWQITWKRSVHCCLGNGHDGKYTHSRPVKYACANEFDMPSPLPCIAPLATEKMADHLETLCRMLPWQYGLPGRYTHSQTVKYAGAKNVNMPSAVP